MNNWTFIIQFSRGHRYYLNEDTRKISVCDYSGKYPDETDDGILYIRNKEGSCIDDIEPEHGSYRMGEVFSIPLIKSDSSVAYTVAEMREALWVSGYFNIPLTPKAEQIMRELHKKLGKAFGSLDLSCD